MKPSEQTAQPTPPTKPIRLKSAGLYGEVAVLPVSRGGPAVFQEPKSFV